MNKNNQAQYNRYLHSNDIVVYIQWTKAHNLSPDK